MSKKNYSVARVVTHTQSSIGKCERHNERKNESYANMNVDMARCDMNVHFKTCGELTYNEQLNKLIAEKKVCMRGLKADAKVFDEVIFDVNTDYFETHGGYEYAKEFYEEAYRFAVALYGEQNIISAVMHADELNVALTEQYGKPVYHYHMHLVALPVVEKQMLTNYENEQRDLMQKVEDAERLINTAQQENIDVRNFLSNIRQCTDLKELTPSIVNKLITKIEIFDRVIGEDEKKRVPIKIHFVGVGVIQLPDAEMLEKTKEEMKAYSKKAS